MSDKDEIISKIAERLSFFFGDPNLRSDRFMQKELAQEDDFGGSLDAAKLLNFQSIKQHTNEVEKVVEAAKTLPELLAVSENNGISRKTPMKKSQLDDNIPLSLHVSNLPVEDQKYIVNVVDIKTLFESYGNVTLTRLQWQPAAPEGGEKSRDKDKKQRRQMVPAGSCVLEFETLEEAEKAAAELIAENGNEKKVLTLKGEDLKIVKLIDYIEFRKQRNKKKEEKGKSESNGAAENGKRDVGKRKEPPIVVEKFEIDWKPGCVIEVKGLDKEKCDRESIKAAVEIEDNSMYADYSRGQSDGALRFSKPCDEIKQFAEKLNSGEIMIAGSKVESARVLEGEEEEAYWKKFIDFKNKQLQVRAEEAANKNKKRRR
mmetsp:Transcript_2183/g.3246  ORF Transcript_2183/g.3246 Transcript_2183/m.3246 type:complete len:373 (+) Transcript_2183:97-1215(+)|eukprot:CAMPEP_0194211134 /NCGR_PEP_ID=MMETSP0156-20130528/9559_1 /TAXON_ID=33649 /ORGANISM="Thalassionema nitzschioides, Strain L26-B" /LENGTH=372 /DNA_ID=CAMNT_0038938587 /DNA_START=42 /DNA_END=1160 /DNA_ORIENTATION=-